MQPSLLNCSQFIEMLPEAAILVRRDGTVAAANAQADILFGCAPGKLTSQRIERLLPEAGVDPSNEEPADFWSRPEQNREPASQNRHAQRMNGEVFPARVKLKAVEMDAEWCILCTIQDDSAEAHVRDRLSWKNRVFLMVRACSQLLVHAADEAEIINEFCRIFVVMGGYRMAWVGYLQPSEPEWLVPAAHDGFEAGYLDAIDRSYARADRSPNPLQRAVSEQKMVVIRDIARDPQAACWRDAALERGYASAIVLPLMDDERVLGVLNIYAAEVDAFDSEKAEMFYEIANDLTFGITEMRLRVAHQKAEEALRESEWRYQCISTAASDYMFSSMVDEQGHLTLNWTVGAFEKITGYTFEEYIAQGGWRGTLHPDELLRDERDLEKLKTNKRLVTEIRTLHKNGQTVWVRVYAYPVWDETNHRLAGIFGAVQDITERKRAEEIIEASEKRLSLIFKTVSDVIFLLAVEPEDCFRFVAINQAFLNITGLKAEQVTGKRVDEVLPPTSYSMVVNKYKKAIRENKTVHWEELSTYPAGTLLGEVAVTPYHNAEGVCTHLVGVVHDITDVRRAEEEIRKLNQELELRVQERTAQLQAANKELESFSYSVSHDLRAPLRAISGFSSIIARRYKKDLNEEAQHYIDNIVQASERMGQLIDDLLTYSRLGREGVRHAPVSLASLLSELKKNMQSHLDEIQGELEIQEGLPTIHSDHTLLRQVFTNLLENAMTYHQPGVPPKVIVSWRIDGNQVVVSVRDNGIGIPLEYQDKIFRMFQRLHSDDEYPGTGIGLANVKKCLDLLNGKVTVESQLGQGANFSVFLAKESS